MPSKIIKLNCPNCGAIAQEVSKTDVLGTIFIKLKCGHTIIEDRVAQSNYEITSSDGRHLFPFQQDGIQFAEESNARCLIADEMGLGKTVQALGMLKLHPELLPALIIVKSSLKIQWFNEVIRWCGPEGYLPQVIPDARTPLLPGFKIYIISFDMLRRMSAEAKATMNVKTVIIDECQQIKNHLSTRAKEVQGICKDVEHIICLSGTPIKNNAGEYFTVLNLLKPRRFPFYAEFIRKYCDAYDNGWSMKVGGIKNVDYFKQDTADFIIRRLRSEVLPELPAISRNFKHVELDKKFEKAYEKAQEEFEEAYYDEEEGAISAIQKMTKMRHLVGFNKIEPTVEFVEEFLLDRNPEEKICIFTHHLDVTALLVNKLREMIRRNDLKTNILELGAGDDKQSIVGQLNSDLNNRVLVASTLAAGEGTDGIQQHCDHIIMMERQWNPANEQQTEDRICRIGQDSKKLTATYMIASGTIDEFFTELVEQKRAIVAATLDHKEIEWNEQSLMKELMDVLAAKGGKRWKL